MPDLSGVELPGIEVNYPDWPAPANVRAFTTTRIGGFSQGPWSQLNLGAHCGDGPNHVRQNRELLRKLLPSDPRWLKQVHGTRAVAWDECLDSEPEADAIFSNQTGQVCAVLTADCLPVLFCDKVGTKVAAVHVGWRGLASGVLEVVVLASECRPAELMVWMGPAIGPHAFEVGKDVYDLFVKLNPENATAFKPQGDRWRANLYELVRIALSKVGIEHVWGRQYCTYSEPDKFFSYRRNGISGRMASLIWLEQ